MLHFQLHTPYRNKHQIFFGRDNTLTLSQPMTPYGIMRLSVAVDVMSSSLDSESKFDGQGCSQVVSSTNVQFRSPVVEVCALGKIRTD